MPDPDPISLTSIRLSIAAITEAFAEVKDPRRDHLKRFPLPDILVLVVAGMLAGCEQCRSLYPRPFVRPNGSFDSRGNERPGRGL